MRIIIFAVCIALGLTGAAAGPARAANDQAATLAQMIANQNGLGREATVVVGALPPKGVGGLPLPKADDAVLVGSVVYTPGTGVLQRFIGTSGATLFYRLTQSSAFDRYAKELIAAGYSERTLGSMRQGGFVVSPDQEKNAQYCASGGRGVSLHVPAADPTELAISYATYSNRTVSPCTAKGMTQMLSGIASEFMPPLPQLHAPAGTQIESTGFPSILGSSVAYVRTTQPLASVLAGFASQFTAAGWQAGEKESGTGLFSQSFAHQTGGKIDWRAVLTVQRAGGIDYAYVSAAKEAGE